MGTLADGTVVAPFANAAMRLLREDWKGKYGSKMLAEELYPILQTGIPQPDQTFQNFVTINAGNNDAFMKFIDKYGNVLYQIDAANGLQKIESPGYPPPKLKPRIVWGPKTINAGDSIGGGELDAVAVDPETGVDIPGVYVYDPPSGTAFPDAGTSTLYVNFTPTDVVKYRRSMGSTVLTVVGSSLKLPDINWPVPADIWLGTALSGTQLNATATDPDTSAPVAGVFVYTPPSGTVLGNDPFALQVLHVDFTPTDTAHYSPNSADNGVNVNGIYGVPRTSQAGGDYTYATQVGDVLVYGVSVTDSSSGATVTVTDTQGNSYTQIGSYVRVNSGGNFLSASLWYAVVGSAGTATLGPGSIATSGGSFPSVEARGFCLLRGVAALDTASSGSGISGSTITAGTTTVSADREIIVLFRSSEAAASSTIVAGWGNTAFFGPGLFTNANQIYVNSASPIGGTSVSTAVITGGTAGALWAAIAASFTHRTS